MENLFRYVPQSTENKSKNRQIENRIKSKKEASLQKKNQSTDWRDNL